MTVLPLTVDVPPESDAGPPAPDALPPRPDDDASLAAFTSWCAQWMWGDDAENVPLRVDGNRVRQWPRSSKHLDPGNDPADYAEWASLHLLEVAATAAICVEVVQSGWPYAPTPDLVMAVTIDGNPVRLDSWRYLDPEYDTPDMWIWHAARRSDGPAATAAAARSLPGALATAQAIRDGLVVLLPQTGEPEPPSAPTPRRNTWR